MKIWIANFEITVDEKFNTKVRFSFEEDKGEWLFIKNFNEYHTYPCLSTPLIRTVSKDMEIIKSYDFFIVRQGFDRKLNEDELEKLRKNMGKSLIDYLKKEYKKYKCEYKAKVNCIKKNLRSEHNNSFYGSCGLEKVCKYNCEIPNFHCSECDGEISEYEKIDY